MVQKLQKELRKKDILLTDIRLEALSSAGQLESLKDTVSKMRVSQIFRKNEIFIIFFNLFKNFLKAEVVEISEMLQLSTYLRRTTCQTKFL